MKDKYTCFRELALAEVYGVDYRICINRRPESLILVVAPHGGSIERRTSHIATAIAGAEYSYYLFEGLDPSGSFDDLHITSHRFDEPTCMRMIADVHSVVTIHGCAGKNKEVLIGGLDDRLKSVIESQLADAGIAVNGDRHRFQGTHEKNICNRGQRKMGVQLEFSDGLRGAPEEAAAIEAVRDGIETFLFS